MRHSVGQECGKEQDDEVKLQCSSETLYLGRERGQGAG